MSASSQPYVDGLAAGVLRYQHCPDCGRAQRLARYACQYCGGASLAWHDARGTGIVHSVTVVTRAPSDAFRALAPYTLVLVDLAEGARVMAHAEPGSAIGDAVTASFFAHDGHHLVRFQVQPNLNSNAVPPAPTNTH